ncbi:MAG TPA: hypothetical protein ENF43_00480, partial [Thermoplasmatales archaeon]|nr:hypothetical protein [Thermoplasmatales archaeon]
MQVVNMRTSCKCTTIFVVLLSIILMLTHLSTAELGPIANITVYIKDQDGNNIVSNDHLIGDLVVELFYEGECLLNKTFNKSKDFIVFEVNHTGLYTIRAVAILGNYLDNYGCIQDLFTSLYNCSNKCPDGGATISIDERGVYRCTPHRYFCHSCNYCLNRSYIVGNEVLTYVDKGENDIAQVTIPTDENILHRLGKRLYERYNETGDTIFLRNISGDVYVEVPWYFIAAKSAGENVIQTGMDEAIDEGADQFIKGSFGKAIKAAPISTIIYISATDPENLFTKETGYKLLQSAGSDAIAARIITAVGATGTTAFGIGFVVAVSIDLGYEYIKNECQEYWRCYTAETDDLDIYIGERLSCTPDEITSFCSVVCVARDPECEKHSVVMVNKGEKLLNVKVTRDYDVRPACCECMKFDSNEKDALYTNEIYEDDVEVDIYTYLAGYTCYSSFNQTARLGHEIEILPGLKCDFDTSVTIPVVCPGMDIPPLSEFQKHKPYIGNVKFPEIIYSDDNFTISAEMVDDFGIENAKVNFEYKGERGSQSGTIEMQKISGTDMHSFWNATSDNLPGYGDGFVEFSITAVDKEGNSVVNDNDQRMFKIRVVDDSLHWGDAPNEKESAWGISSFGYDINGWLLPRQNEQIDKEQ